MNMPPPGMQPPGSGPPGMMGSGPPPMGMLPPDMSGEVWVEAKAADGKSYFYHSRTRETTWTKPEGSLKVIPQEQVSPKLYDCSL